MQEQTGTIEQKLKDMGALKICEGAAHLQNTIENDWCYICHKPKSNDMALLRRKGKEFVYICLDHPGAVAEFIRCYHRPPLGWSVVK